MSAEEARDDGIRPASTFWGHVQRKEGCWTWTGPVAPNGYGVTAVKRGGRRSSAGAHRVVYEALVGPIPAGLQIDHLCRNRQCVNPDHMEVVTPRVNTMRGTSPAVVNAAKVRCDKGHPFDAANARTVRRSNGDTERACRECGRQANARYRARHAAPIRVFEVVR